MGTSAKVDQLDTGVTAGIYHLLQRGCPVTANPIRNDDYLVAVACIQMSQAFESKSQQKRHIHRRRK
jgi:hypothetical protein